MRLTEKPYYKQPKFKKGYNKYDNPKHYKDYEAPTIIEAEVSDNA